jgi:cytochrome d ubiquinol oxidase subunit II
MSVARSARSATSFAAIGLFAMCYLGLGISIWPMVVPYTVSLWSAASQAFLVIGTVFLLPIIVMYTGWSSAGRFARTPDTTSRCLRL